MDVSYLNFLCKLLRYKGEVKMPKNSYTYYRFLYQYYGF